jgi:AcrR family transcriptional regulator
MVPIARIFFVKTESRQSPRRPTGKTDPDHPIRARILQAAFAAFQEHGFGGASTLEIASRAKVSKRELYALFSNKQAMLAACITERAKRIRLPLESPQLLDRPAISSTLTAFGMAVLHGICDARTLAVYRLAIAEPIPEVAHILDEAGRKANRAALVGFLKKAQKHGYFSSGQPDAMAACFLALLWGDLLPGLLLRVTGPPAPKEIKRRARTATEALFTLYS